jgi:hypothetical protein
MISRWQKKILSSSRFRRSGGPGPNTTPVEATCSPDETTTLRSDIPSPRAFSYVPLQNSKSDFRLVILDPATDYASNLCCTVLNSSLDSVCEYEALSYVWGECEALNPIFLRHASLSNESPTQAETHSFEFSVKLNLEAALRSLRLPDKPRTLWIDSICINQSNLKERTEQVNLMGRIYRQCRRDLLWLGSETDKIRRAMNLIQRLIPCNENEANISELLEDDWSDIEAMIGANQVWRRIWIVQEFYFAPKILLFCHGQSLDWDVVVKMIEDNQDFQDIMVNQCGTKLFQVAHRCFDSITTFQTIKHELSSAGGLFDQNFMSLVLTFSSWGATHRIDRIYALRNLAEDASDFQLDYTKSLNEVSVDFSEHIIIHNKSLSILSAALGDLFDYTRVGATPLKSLPSWVMDISQHIPTVSGLTAFGQSCYNACGILTDARCTLSPDRQVLFASGLAVDAIDMLNTVSPIRDGETPRERWIRDVHRWAPKDGMETSYVPTSETALDAYWRTITTDRIQDRRILRENIEGSTRNERSESLDERTVPNEQVCLPGWRFGTGRSRMFCMLPPNAQKGDSIVVLFGGKVPYLLRPIEQVEGLYELVGEAYIHGFMDGKVVEDFLKKFGGGRAMPQCFPIV